MGVLPVGKLLVSLSLPMMFSMLVQALYNIVDSIFVSRLSEKAMSAVTMAYPMFNLMIAVATGTLVGLNALLSRSLGEREYERANDTAKNGIFLMILSALLFTLLGTFFPRVYFEFQTSDPELLSYGVDYLSICLLFSFSLFGQMLFERLLQSTGKATLSMISQIVGAVVNIILDPILIFGYFGLPALGVRGAAIATVFGQFCGMAVGFIMNMKYNHDISLSMRKFKAKLSIIKNIYAVGLPSIVMQSIGSLTSFLLNNILLGFTSTATAVYGVYFNLQSFLFMPLFGMNSGVISIVAYNYGAKYKDRIIRTIKLAFMFVLVLMAIGTLVFQLFPAQLLGLYDASPEMLEIGVPAMRTLSAIFVLAGFCILSSTIFQALGHGVMSLVTSICRQVVILIPAAFLLARLGNVNYVWLAFPIAEVASVALSAIFLVRIFKTVIKPIVPREHPAADTLVEEIETT